MCICKRCLPDAAEIPCRVERYLVVNSSTGVMKVVALGPKLAKKKVCKCRHDRSDMCTGTLPELGYIPTEWAIMRELQIFLSLQ